MILGHNEKPAEETLPGRQDLKSDNFPADGRPPGKEMAKRLLGLLVLFGFLGFLFPFVFGLAHDEPPSNELCDPLSRYPPRPVYIAGKAFEPYCPACPDGFSNLRMVNLPESKQMTPVWQ